MGAAKKGVEEADDPAGSGPEEPETGSCPAVTKEGEADRPSERAAERAKKGTPLGVGGASVREGASLERMTLPGGIDIPRLGLGTFQLEGSACRRTVGKALALGYRHIDSAEGYGNEEAIGRAVRRSRVPRDHVVLVSKVWRDHLRPPDLRRRVEGSLRRLGTSYLDLYLVHWPNRQIPADATAAGMERLREEGLIRAWGVSNFTAAHLEEMLPHGTISTNQVELHPYFGQDELATFCAARGLPITAYSPVARGRVMEDPVLREIAAGRDRSPAQVALRWIVQRGHLAIPKASTEDHLRDNLGALEFSLDDGEMAAVEGRPTGQRLFDYEWSEFDR